MEPADRPGAGPTPLWTLPAVDRTELAGHADVFPLSAQQRFLRLVDKGDGTGPFGSRYTIVGGWRVRGPLDERLLRAALADVVARHEALRTRIVIDTTAPYQRVVAAGPADLEVHHLGHAAPDLRDRVAEEFLNDVEAQPFSRSRMPSLRAVLGRFDAQDAVLVLVAHHTAVDGWSMQVLVRDLAAFYVARDTGRAPDLPALSQYREYVAWQRVMADAPATVRARAYWRESLRGARVTPIGTDRARGSVRPVSTAWHRFMLDEQTRTAVLGVARATRSSPFMVLLSAYAALLGERTGEVDIVVPTFTPGRPRAWTQEIVGSLFNFLPLRVDLTGRLTFHDLVERVRRRCLAAYAHELPFEYVLEDCPRLMSAAADERAAACVFQVVQSPFMMFDRPAGPLRYTAMRRRLLSQRVGSAIPDGALWALEPHPDGGIVGSVGFNSDLFDESTIVTLVDQLDGMLRRILARPDRPLAVP